MDVKINDLGQGRLSQSLVSDKLKALDCIKTVIV